MNLMALDIAERQRTAQLTLLHRPGGIWHRSELGKLVNGLMTEAVQHPEHPEHVILWGTHSKAETLKAIGGGVAYTATPVVGLDNPSLPWRPSFC